VCTVILVDLVLLWGAVELILRLILGPPPPSVQVFSGLEAKDHYLDIVDGRVQTLFQVYEVIDGGQNTGGHAGALADDEVWKDEVGMQHDKAVLISQRTDRDRVVVIGGSAVHSGSGISQRLEFPARLGQWLGVETLNLGAPALDTHDLVALMGELAQVDYSVLVVYAGHNDFGNTYFQNRYGDMAGGLAARFRAFLDRFQLFAQTRRVLGNVQGNPDEVFRPLDLTRMWATLRFYEANLRRIAWLADQQGVDLVMVVPTSSLTHSPVETGCTVEPCAATYWQKGLILARTDPDQALDLLSEARDMDSIPLRTPSAAQDAVRRVAADVGARLVDPSRELPRDFELDIPSRSYFKDIVHLNAAGHQAMAELIGPTVAEILQE
jgi:lysophospholipase L1-like esterase